MARIKGKSIIFEVDGTEYQGGVSNVVFSSAVNTLGFGDYEDSLDFTCAVKGRLVRRIRGERRRSG